MFSAAKTTAPSGYNISRSVRLRSSASAYFNRTPASAGNRKTWTWSAWVKRARTTSSVPDEDRLFNVTGAGTDTTLFSILFDASTAKLAVVTGATTFRVTSAVYRDPSAWYHIVVALDTTQATAANRLRLYVNGSEVTAFDTNNAPTQNTDYGINQGSVEHFIGRYTATTPNRYFEGYLTEINFIDGQALTPSSFGATNSTTGVWQPIRYTGTYGTNGFYLNFSDNSAATAAAIGKDYSGNGNNWTPNNISVTSGVTYDSMLDVPTPWADGGNGRGNYAVLNPIDLSAIQYQGLSSILISGGNLNIPASGSNYHVALSSIGVTTGSWYWESTIVTATGGSNNQWHGIVNPKSSTMLVQWTCGGSANGEIYVNGTLAVSGTSYKYTTNDVIAFAVNASTGAFTLYKNGSSVYTGTYTAPSDPVFAFFDTESAGALAANFGQRPFTYTPPTGYVALNTQNLPTPTIKNGANYMAATLWTGNGSTQSIVNAGAFQPDLVWAKDRTTTNFHALYDSVRGATKDLQSNTTTAEQTFATGLTSFNSNGFTTGSNSDTNANGDAYVAWQWQAGAGSSSSNTSGSITSTVSVNATAGFSIVTASASGTSPVTMGHGLGVAPSFIIGRVRNNTANWYVYSSSFSSQDYLVLNSTAAKATSSNIWDSAPTSTVLTVGNPQNGWNGGTAGSYNYVLYCWAQVTGFSKFGSYTGNGSADGPFVYCGFRPRFVMIKNTSGADDWFIKDTSRSQYNTMNEILYPNNSNAEGSRVPLDCLSNGFKIRDSASNQNTNGSTYIYAAFAENPLNYSLAR